jgi:UDP-N-acetylglucosamine diphosphorylase/glucosamine-1-phosphate N-acetyltransferase
MFSLKERWELFLNEEVEILTEDYIQPFYNHFPEGDLLLIDASVLPTITLANAAKQIPIGSHLFNSKGFIAGRLFANHPLHLPQLFKEGFAQIIEWQQEVTRINYPWQLFQQNATIIKEDFDFFTNSNSPKHLNNVNLIINVQDVFVEEEANVVGCVLDATDGPIYIGKKTTIMPGTCIKGPFVIGINSVVKMGAKIYGATSIGNNCMVGGEIKNSIIFNNSNKAHDGYLGDSVIGEWCNLGAGTTNSNLKNNASTININNVATNTTHDVGNKCGVFMGHYTKMAINSSINTGSVFGVASNIFGSGLLPKQINSFTWGVSEEYELEKCLADINNWMQLKKVSLGETEKTMIINYKNQL